jgi:hypothetical protein
VIFVSGGCAATSTSQIGVGTQKMVEDSTAAMSKILNSAVLLVGILRIIKGYVSAEPWDHAALTNRFRLAPWLCLDLDEIVPLFRVR